MHSLERRILIALTGVFILGFGSLAVYLYDTRDELRRSVMFIQAQEIAAGLTAQSDMDQLPTHYAGGELSYTLYTADGIPLWHSSNLKQPRKLRHDTINDAGRLFRLPLRSGLVVNVPVRLADGSVLMVAKKDEMERSIIGSLLQARLLRGLMIFLPMCLLAAYLIRWLLNWTLQPIKQAAKVSTEIGPGQPDLRIPLDGLPREILPLARAANLGLDRLADAFETEKRIVADAAHELRTPLTVLDLRLQKSRGDNVTDWPAIEHSMQQIRRLVNQLLALAQQEQPFAKLQQSNSVTALSRITREAVALTIPMIEAQGRDIQVNIEDAVEVQGEPSLLMGAIRNVLDNALMHGTGTIRVSLTQSPHEVWTLDIADEGPGVPLCQQEEMFTRFRKGRQHSNGSGLGLAIARQTVLNAGGNIRFISQSPCVVRIELVIARAPTAQCHPQSA